MLLLLQEKMIRKIVKRVVNNPKSLSNQVNKMSSIESRLNGS
jgi:hypothetical protein